MSGISVFDKVINGKLAVSSRKCGRLAMKHIQKLC